MSAMKAFSEENADLLKKLIHDMKTPLSTLRMAVSNVEFMLADHITEARKRQEFEDILVDAQNSIRDITQTIQLFHEILIRNEDKGKLLHLSDVVNEFRQRVSDDNGVIRVNIGSDASHSIFWKGYPLVSVLIGLMRTLAAFQAHSPVLQVWPKNNEGENGIVRFCFSATMDTPNPKITSFIEGKKEFLIAKWALLCNAIPVNLNQTGKTINICFDVPTGKE